MPETRDEINIAADDLAGKLADTMDPENAHLWVYEFARLVWNARGKADVAAIDTADGVVYLGNVELAIRSLDR